MSNQRTYKIIINGVSESITEVDVLLDKLDKLDKKLSNMEKKVVKVKVEETTSTKQSTSALDKEIIKNDKLRTEEYQKQVQLQERLKQENKEIIKQQKEIASGVRDANGEYANTLAGQRALLSEMKKQLASIDLDDTDAFEEMAEEVDALNTKVKELEESFGVFGRNVGNYTNSVVDALNEFDGQMYQTVDGIKEVSKSVDSLKGKQLFDVNIGNQVVQFENVSQAIGEIDDMAHRAAAQMQALRDAGKQNTTEYDKLNREFQEFITISANLERVRKQTDELRDSIASSTRGLDMGVQGFQALGNAMQMASGIAGLFGQNQEKVEEAINRTVQIQAILQSAQELYNQAIQKGTVLNTIYSNTFGKITSGIGRMVTSLNLGTKAAKGLNTVLKANIFVAIASAILYVVTNLDKLSNILGITNKETQAFTNLWNKVSPVIMGVGRVITDALINPIRTLILTVSKLIDGDFSGAFEEISKGFKEQFNVIEDYQKGYNDEIIAQQERATKKQKIELDKQLLNDIRYNEAKYGSDWKYTKKGIELYRQYFANKLALYNKDTDEYKEALIEQLNFERELKEFNKTSLSNTIDKENERLQVEREIEDKLLSIMKDGNTKRMEELKLQRRRELEDAELRKKQGELKEHEYQKLISAIKQEYNEKEKDEMNQHYVEVNNLKKELERSLINDNSDINVGTFNNLLQANYRDIDELKKQINDFNKIWENQFTDKSYLTKFKMGDNGELDEVSVSLEERLKNALGVVNRLYSDVFGEVSETTKKALTELSEYYNEEELRNLKKYAGQKIGIIIEMLNNNLKLENEYFEREKSEENRHYDELLQQHIKAEEKELDNVELTEKEKQDIKDKYQKLYEQINDNHYKRIEVLEKQHEENILQIKKDSVYQRSEILSKYHDTVYNEYRKNYDQLNQLREEYSNIDEVNLPSELSSMGSFTTQILEMDKFKKSFKTMKEEVIKQKAQLVQQFEDGVISEDAFNKSYAQLDQLEDEIKTSLDEISMDWKDWATSIAEVASAMISMWSQTFSMIADMQYNNEMKRIEDLEKGYDEELEILQDKLEEQEELYEKHNENVLSIEDELSTARGDRRLFLLDQINSEMMKREQAWATQQKIAKQQEQLEKKKEQLEKQKEAAEKKRNKANQKVQIAQGLANTALAVTNALAVNPWFVGVALAAVAAAMGAAQVAIIAKQKYADGGVIQGKSHSEGGVPVLGGTAEVEGNEFITNKTTTTKNVDLLYYINSKKKKLDLNDFIEFYVGKPSSSKMVPAFKYAEGGQLPTNTAPQIDVRDVVNYNQQDNRPIYVSVVEIESVQDRVRNVRAISGIE